MDAVQKHYWNITQLMAWVLLRNHDLVRQAANDVWDFGMERAYGKVPDGTIKAYQRHNPPPDKLEFDLRAVMEEKKYFGSYEVAWLDVRNALHNDRLPAYGLANGHGDQVRIEPIRWADLVFHFPKRDRPYAAPRDTRPGSTKWKCVQFPRERIMELWPTSVEAELLDKGKQEPKDASGDQSPPRPVGELVTVDGASAFEIPGDALAADGHRLRQERRTALDWLRDHHGNQWPHPGEQLTDLEAASGVKRDTFKDAVRKLAPAAVFRAWDDTLRRGPKSKKTG